MVKKQMLFLFLEANHLRFMLAIAYFAQPTALPFHNISNYSLLPVMSKLIFHAFRSHSSQLYKGRDFRYFLFIFHY